MKSALGAFVLGLVSLVSTGCADKPVGSKARPLAMYFVPSVDATAITAHATELEKFMAKFMSQKLYGKDSGFYVKAAVPTSYVTVVEAFGTKKADFAFFTSFAYILAREIKKYDVEPMFVVARGPEHGTTYKGQFIARADSGIKSVKDLQGKKFAFVDPASTSGYILPAQTLKANKIKLGETVFANKHDNVVTMVIQKQVDAGATYWTQAEKMTRPDGTVVSEIRDARMRVLTQYPDAEKTVNIIGFTAEVPNEPWVVRGNMYPKDPALNEKVKAFLREGILEFIKTPEGKDTLYTVSTGSGLEPATPELYHALRDMILSSEVDIAASLK